MDWDKLYLAYDWAKEWQILLAGLLVFLAALIFARATIKAAKMGSSARRPQPDLRLAPTPPAPSSAGPETSTVASTELISTLEQLRSLIRSALASLPAAGEKENSPITFLCQRILHLRLDQLASPAHNGQGAQEGYAALQKQLTILRSHLKNDAPAEKISEILIQINATARSLVAGLLPASEKRRQVETR